MTNYVRSTLCKITNKKKSNNFKYCTFQKVNIKSQDTTECFKFVFTKKVCLARKKTGKKLQKGCFHRTFSIALNNF